MEATVATVKRLGILGNTGLLGIKRGRDWKKNSYAVMYVQTLERQELTDHNLKKLAFGTGQISGCNIPPAWTEQILEVDQFAFVKLFEQPGWQASESIAGRQFLGTEALTTRGT